MGKNVQVKYTFDLCGLRLKLGLTQEEMAYILGRSRYWYITTEKSSEITLSMYCILKERFPDFVELPEDFYLYERNTVKNYLADNGILIKDIAALTGYIQSTLNSKFCQDNLYDMKDLLKSSIGYPPEGMDKIMQMPSKEEAPLFINECKMCKKCVVDMKEKKMVCRNEKNIENIGKDIEDISKKQMFCPHHEYMETFEYYWILE